MTQKHSGRMRRLTAAGLLPERAGQPVRAWAHISLADLLRLDGDSALQEEWTERVRARWAARRAAASETGASDGAWLDGDAAAAVACDACRQPRRNHQRVEQEQDQSPAQPRTTRPRRVTAPAHGLSAQCAIDP
jgi:hypothetical protein